MDKFASVTTEPPLLGAEVGRALDLLREWEVVHLRVTARAARAIPVAFAGSLLRGAIGAALTRRGCAAGLFGDEANFARRGSPARPWALVPPERIEPGPLRFELKLFGPSSARLDGLLEAIVDLGRAGIGRERVPLSVEAIESLAPARIAAPALDGAVLDQPRRVRLLLSTPLRMKEAGRISGRLAPERWIRASLRRLVDIGGALGQAWPRSWPSILEASRSMRLIREETRWLDWGRYSLRQGRPMRLGGILGWIEYAGVPAALLPLLRAACFAHLGKNSTFGLGQAALEEIG